MFSLHKNYLWSLNQDVIDGRAVIASFKGPDDCGHGDDSELYYCPQTDSCCSDPADNGDDWDYVCCPPEDYPYICATDADTCNWHP